MSYKNEQEVYLPLLSKSYKINNKKSNKNDSVSSSEPNPDQDQIDLKTSKNILMEYLKIFSLATFQDKFFILIGIVSTIIHGLCFLGIAMILKNMTVPFIQQSIQGYRNTTLDDNSINNGNITQHLLTKQEFITTMDNFSIYYICIAGVIFLFSFLQTFLWELAAEDQSYQIRKRFTFQILRQEMPFFKTHPTEPLCFILTQAVEKVREGIGHKFSMVLQYATICVVQVGFALITNWKLTMIFLTISPLPALLAKFLNFGKLLSQREEIEQKKYAKASSNASDILSNVRLVFIYGKEYFEVERYRQALFNAASCALIKYIVQSLGIGIFLFLLFGSYAIAFDKACSSIEHHSGAVSDIYTVFFTVTIAVFSLGQILPWISTISEAQGSADILVNILCLPNPNIDASRLDTSKNILSNLSGALKFNDVIFGYKSKDGTANTEQKIPPSPIPPPDMNIPKISNLNLLNNLTLEIKPKQNIGIIGYNGSGKTTIGNLMLRFYDPIFGKIFIDNIDIKELDVAWYRKQFGIVGQQLINFQEGTLLENIYAGRKDITLEKVIEVAKLVDVHDFIMSFQNNYETPVGVTDWQCEASMITKIAIVRALVREPTWFILDGCFEPLSDFPKISANILNFRKEQINIFIGNRTDHVKDMDIIHFLDGGKIVESGSFDELMKLEGYFYKMRQKEFAPMMASYTVRLICEPQDDIEPDKDDKLTAQISEEAKRMIQNYPGLWEILKLTNHNCKDWCYWGFAGLGCFLTALVIPMFSLYYTDIFKEFGKTSDGLQNDSQFWTLMLIVLAVIACVGFWIRNFFVQAAGEFMILELRKMSLKSILSRPLIWFENNKMSPTSLANRLSQGVPAIKAALNNRFSTAISGLISITIAIIIVLILCWQIGIGLIICVIIIIILAVIQNLGQRKFQRASVALAETSTKIFRNAIQEIWTIQSLSQERDIRQRHTNLIYGNLVDRQRICIIFAFMLAFSEMLIYVLLALALHYGSYLIEIDAIEPITFFRVFLILVFCLITFGHTISFVPDYTKAELAFGQMIDLIHGNDETSQILNIKDTKYDMINWNYEPPSIEFQNVNYNKIYGKQTWPITILQNCSFKIPSKKTLVITGDGTNKSIFLTLILQLYEIEESGQILFNDINVQKLDIFKVRGNIGYVPQEPDLFKGSISDNILYGYQGQLGALEQKCVVGRMIEKVGLNIFIENLNDGYETIVDDDGCPGLNKLIKIKLMMARALIRNPKILLLDEPTNGLNANDELDMLNLIKQIKIGTTCIITTTKHSLVKEGDLVGMFVGCNLLEFGTNEELAKDTNSYYHEFMTRGDPTTLGTTIYYL